MNVKKIIPKREEKEIPFHNELIPTPPIRLLINAQSGSGKTNLLLNLLNDEFYGKYFKKDRIHITSKSLFTDPLWTNISDDTLRNAESSIDGEEIQDILEEYIEDVEENGKTQENASLWIFDDCIEDLFNRGGKPKLVEKFYIRFRHANASIIVVSQEYMLIPKSIRKNATGLIVFQLFNKDEIKALYRERGGMLKYNDFIALLQRIWKEPYNFLFMDFKKPSGQQMRINFGEYINLSHLQQDKS